MSFISLFNFNLSPYGLLAAGTEAVAVGDGVTVDTGVWEAAVVGNADDVVRGGSDTKCTDVLVGIGEAVVFAVAVDDGAWEDVVVGNADDVVRGGGDTKCADVLVGIGEAVVSPSGEYNGGVAVFIGVSTTGFSSSPSIVKVISISKASFGTLRAVVDVISFCTVGYNNVESVLSDAA